MIQIQIDEAAVKEMYMEAIVEKIKEIDEELVFWDSKELRRRTCLSWGTIQDTFFHEPGFPKIKVGGKWMYPAKEVESFLIDWLKGRAQ